MKPMKTREIEKLLEQHNYVLIRSGKHKVYSNGSNSIVVNHAKTVSTGVASKIIKILKGGQIARTN